ncbi:MAG: hypothetical protein BWY94_01266 [Actinobacteria bacterium ADurb.BinA094]|nr:MAG: hypothetical protein BWY94_01266 [Actinobacteria bacterium ADurb.BinA094]
MTQVLVATTRAGGVQGEAQGAFHRPAGETGERLRDARVHVVSRDQERRELTVADRMELHDLAARDDRRAHTLPAVRHQDEDDVGGRFLEALQERVGRALDEVLDLRDDPHAPPGQEWLKAQLAAHGLDLLEEVDVALPLQKMQVGVQPGARPGALRAGAAVAAGGDEGDAEVAAELRLGQAFRAGQQVRVADGALGDDPFEERLGPRLTGDTLEHGAASAAGPRVDGDGLERGRLDVGGDRLHRA